jgi:hypothetical protein
MKLFSQIDDALTQIGHGWTEPDQAACMAATVIALRPMLSIEIGVYAGKGLVTLALAHKEVGYGSVIGIDPYSAIASAEGQLNPAHHKFWGELDHELFYGFAKENIQKFDVGGYASIVRKKSSEYNPPDGIGLLRIDGNHGEQVLQDIKLYGTKVSMGGVLFLDDLDWTGGAVVRAAAMLRMGGWKELYRLKKTAVFQKVA